LILMLFKKDLRENIFGMFKIVANPTIIFTNLLMLIYVSAIIFFLWSFNIWDNSLIKGTLLWAIFIAIPLFFKANRANQQEHYIRKLLKESIKIIVVLEFLINLYVFPFMLEFIFIPIAVLLAGMGAVSETNKKYSSIKIFTDFTIGILGVISIAFVIYNIIFNFNSFANYENIKSFLLPLLLTVLFIPAIYFQALFMNYEVTFIRLGAFCKDDSLLRYAKFRMITYCNLNLYRAKIFAKGLVHFNYDNKQEFKKSLKQI